MRRESIAIIISVLVVVVAMCGCSKEEAPVQRAPQSPTILVSAAPSEEGSGMVFDFADFSREYYAQDQWSIDELMEKYGDYRLLAANYIPEFDIMFVRVEFELLMIYFFPENAAAFSFYNDSLEAGDYELGAGDREMKLEVLGLDIYAKGIILPYEIQIGSSTKSEVIKAYPAGAISFSQLVDESDAYADIVSFAYDFNESERPSAEFAHSGQPGSVMYIFDENEVLNNANIGWYYFDI